MGAEWSFCDEAARFWLQSQPFEAEMKYLISAEGVFDALENKAAELGFLALQNAAGGIVSETVQSLARYRCKIIEYVPYQIDQCLLAKKEGIHANAICSHPHALAQCSIILNTEFAQTPLISTADTALAARQLAMGEISPETYVIASENAARHYNLFIVKKSIQNLAKNKTDFIVVRLTDEK